MMRRIALTIALTMLVPIAGAATPLAPVATLNTDQGTVLVNNGSQFVTAKPGQVLNAGDRVMVMSGGAATVKYANGQTASLPANTLVSFDSRSFGAYASMPAGGSHTTSIGPMYADSIGGGNGGDTNSNSHVGAWVLGGIGAAVLLIAATHHSNHHVTDHSISRP